jgi:hypothetical protein
MFQSPLIRIDPESCDERSNERDRERHLQFDRSCLDQALHEFRPKALLRS